MSESLALSDPWPVHGWMLGSAETARYIQSHDSAQLIHARLEKLTTNGIAELRCAVERLKAPAAQVLQNETPCVPCLTSGTRLERSMSESLVSSDPWLVHGWMSGSAETTHHIQSHDSAQLIDARLQKLTTEGSAGLSLCS